MQIQYGFGSEARVRCSPYPAGQCHILVIFIFIVIIFIVIIVILIVIVILDGDDNGRTIHCG